MRDVVSVKMVESEICLLREKQQNSQIKSWQKLRSQYKKLFSRIFLYTELCFGQIILGAIVPHHQEQCDRTFAKIRKNHECTSYCYFDN